MKDRTALVTGAGGFIGHHLVGYLKGLGYRVRGVDLKRPEFEPSEADEFLLLDLRRWESCLEATEGVQDVYALGAERYLFSSSACVYPEYRQEEAEVTPLKEEDAYPAMPQDAYGWEKLVTERLCGHYREEFGLETRVVRFHNIFGPLGTWDGGREKAPAALCRKIAEAKLEGDREIEIWGDGEQTRSFCYVEDCVEGIHRLMESDHGEPLNLGQDRMVTINELADMIADAAGIEIVKNHVPGPQGVRGRNSDNTRLKQVLEWEPRISLEEGLARTYAWIEDQVRDRLASEEPEPREAALEPEA